MPKRNKILASSALLVLLLLAIWLALSRGVARSHIGVGFTTASRHFPEPARVAADEIVVLWVTNTGRSTITLDMPYVLFEDGTGRQVRDNGGSWNQKAYGVTLLPGSVAWLANGFDRQDDKRTLKFMFDYHWDGGPVLRGITKTARYLRLSKSDGAFHRHFESRWFGNPQGGANGRQPVSSDTNRTPAAAASRHSP